jgi:hypothetical protein
MAYRNENGYMRPVNTTTSATTTGATAGDNERTVNWINFIFGSFILFFSKLLDKRAIQELIKEVDPMMQIDEEVEDVYIWILDLFFFSF